MSIDVRPSIEDLKVVSLVASRKLCNETLDTNTTPNAIITDDELFQLILPDKNKEAFVNWLKGWPYSIIVGQLITDGFLVRQSGGYQRTAKCYFSEEEIEAIDPDQSMYELTIMCWQIDSKRSLGGFFYGR